MCLYSKTSKAVKAKDDIVCYKLLNRYETMNGTILYITPYTGKIINIKKTTAGRFIKKKDYLNFILNKKINKIDRLRTTNGCSEAYMIEDGFIHTLENKEKAFEFRNEKFGTSLISSGCVYKCIIPKGTYYYKGIFNDYASRKIKILERIY